MRRESRLGDSAGASTRNRLLDAAERAFSERGFDGVSLRLIASESGVNLASAHYHFGSKAALFEAVFARLANRITNERLRLLALVDNDPKNEYLLEQVIDAFLRPVVVDLPGGEGGTYARIRSWMIADVGELARTLPNRYFRESSHDFISAISCALPHLPQEDIFWKFHIMLAAMFFTIANPARIEELSGYVVDTSNREACLQYLVRFFSSAFRSSALSPQPIGRRRTRARGQRSWRKSRIASGDRR